MNLLEDAEGNIKANFIKGTTVSGTSYQMDEVSPGIFEGQIRGKPEFTLRLVVSETPAENKFIKGYKASLDVIAPTVLKASGSEEIRTVKSDVFVCGKQEHSYR